MDEAKVSNVGSEFDSSYAPHIEMIFEVSSLNKRVVYDQFVKLYGGFVVHLVTRHNKVTSNARTREIIQEIFLQLKQANVIEKFFELVHTSEKMTHITGEQAAQALGISWEMFTYTIGLFESANPRQVWMPVPTKGNSGSKEALYLTSEVIRLMEAEFFQNEEVDTSVLIPNPSKRYFQNYLSTTVHNRFKNFCRYEERHNKERVWDTFSEFRSISDDPTSWENRLPDKTQCNQEAHAEIALLVRKIQSTPVADRTDEIMTLLGDGYDIDEAIQKLEGVNPIQRRKTQRLLAPWIQVVMEKRAARNERKSRKVALAPQKEETPQQVTPQSEIL